MTGEVQNLSFAGGAVGNMPPGWQLTRDYGAKTVLGASCYTGQQCATVFPTRDVAAAGTGFLHEVVDAAPYRGKMLVFRAAVRVDASVHSVARLVVRVEAPDCGVSFADDMGDRPITSGTWAFYEIRAPIDRKARDIEFGIEVVGRGTAWIDNVTLDSVSAAQ